MLPPRCSQPPCKNIEVTNVAQLGTVINSAGSVSLALERVKSFGENSLVVMASSPTVESQSGDQADAG